MRVGHGLLDNSLELLLPAVGVFEGESLERCMIPPGSPVAGDFSSQVLGFAGSATVLAQGYPAAGADFS